MGLNHRKIKTTLTLALALGAIVPAAASARLELNPRPARTTPSQPAVQIVRVSAPGGFDWGDAGIGAAGALGLSTLAIGSGTRDRRQTTPNARHGRSGAPRNATSTSCR